MSFQTSLTLFFYYFCNILRLHFVVKCYDLQVLCTDRAHSIVFEYDPSLYITIVHLIGLSLEQMTHCVPYRFISDISKYILKNFG